MYSQVSAREPLAGQHVRDAGWIGGKRLGRDAPHRLLDRHGLLRARGTPRAGVISSGPHGRRAVRSAPRRPPTGIAARRPRARSAVDQAVRRSRARSPPSRTPPRRPLPPASSRLMSSLLAHEVGHLVAAAAGAAHVDRQPQRVVAVHARPSGQPLVQHVEAGQRADLLARLGQRRIVSSSSARPSYGGEAARRVERSRAAASWGWSTRPASPRGRRPARRAARLSRARGAASPTASGCRRSCGCSRRPGRRPPRAHARAAPRGRRGARPRPRPPPAAHRVRERRRSGPPRRRRRRSRSVRPTIAPDRARVRGQRAVERLGRRGSARCRDPGSISGATNVGRSPERTSPSTVLECTFRCTTTRSPRCASARQAAWLPCEAPLIRNQRAPRAPRLGRHLPAHAGRASARAPRRCPGSAPGCRARAPAPRSPRPARARPPARPCDRARGTARDFGRRRRAAPRGRALRSCRAGAMQASLL